MVKCPYCENELEDIFYTEHGSKEKGKKGWKDTGDGDFEAYCPDCNGKFDDDFLEEIGFFLNEVDEQETAEDKLKSFMQSLTEDERREVWNAFHKQIEGTR